MKPTKPTYTTYVVNVHEETQRPLGQPQMDFSEPGKKDVEPFPWVRGSQNVQRPLGLPQLYPADPAFGAGVDEEQHAQPAATEDNSAQRTLGAPAMQFGKET